MLKFVLTRFFADALPTDALGDKNEKNRSVYRNPVADIRSKCHFARKLYKCLQQPCQFIIGKIMFSQDTIFATFVVL